MDEASDPNIVNRLSKLPPFVDEKGNVIDSPIEPTPEPETAEEDINKETEVPQEDINNEPLVEVDEKVEDKQEESKKTDKDEKGDVDEDEALKNSKQPERTKKYIDKLKSQNEELKRKNILDSLTPEYVPEYTPQTNIFSPTTNVVPQNIPGVSQQQVNEAFKEIMDENGYVDRGLLNSTIAGLVDKNQKLEKQLAEERETNKKTVRTIDDFQREQVMKDIHSKYPKLNPDNAGDDVPEDKKFDDRLWQYVHKEMVSSWVREAESGKVVDPNDKKQQAILLEKLTQKGMDLLSEDLLNDEGEVDPSRIMNKKEKQKKDEATNAKINISATSSKQAHQADWSDHDALVKATLRGERGALAERLRRAGQ